MLRRRPAGAVWHDGVRRAVRTRCATSARPVSAWRRASRRACGARLPCGGEGASRRSAGLLVRVLVEGHGGVTARARARGAPGDQTRSASSRCPSRPPPTRGTKRRARSSGASRSGAGTTPAMARDPGLRQLRAPRTAARPTGGPRRAYAASIGAGGSSPASTCSSSSPVTHCTLPEPAGAAASRRHGGVILPTALAPRLSRAAAFAPGFADGRVVAGRRPTGAPAAASAVAPRTGLPAAGSPAGTCSGVTPEGEQRGDLPAPADRERVPAGSRAAAAPVTPWPPRVGRAGGPAAPRSAALRA